ncbi:hypothetical protein CHUAL_007445 [Chamberlinius hualienensis]
MNVIVKYSVFFLFLNILLSEALYDNIDIYSNVIYEDEKWVGNVLCDFYDQENCALSMHAQGKRIDADSENSSTVFVSCISSNKSIGLFINGMTNDDIDYYTCLQDITKEYASTWLNTYPHIEVIGVPVVGSLFSLTCNSIPGTTLYWIFPGYPETNDDVIIEDTSNEVNSSTTVLILIEEDDINNRNEYRCCAHVKPGQYPIPCNSYIFHVNGSDSDVYLESSNSDYMNSDQMIMTCTLKNTNGDIDPRLISWKYCETPTSSCGTFSSNAYTVDNETTTLTTTLKVSYNDYYPVSKCLYDSRIYYTFNATLGTKSPRITETDRRVFNSDDGFSVILSCVANAYPQPNFTWTKKNVFSFANGSEVLSSSGSYIIETQQVSDYEWKSILTIFPYDFNNDDAIFTCLSKNELGNQSIDMNTTWEPADMNLMEMNSSAYFQTVFCAYEAFPFTSNYIINLISVETVIGFNSTAVYDSRLQRQTVIAEIGVFTEVIVECVAFNPFNPSQIISQTVELDR